MPIAVDHFIVHVEQCAPAAHAETLLRIARQESALKPWALSVNYPKGTAAKLGQPGGYAHLQKQPTSKEQAVRWAEKLVQQGHTVSLGLMQVSSQNLAAHGYTIEQAFDLCTNINLGAVILADAMKRAQGSDDPLSAALSIYNSGDTRTGIANGYAAGVQGQPGRFAGAKRPETAKKTPPQGGAVAAYSFRQALAAPTGIAWPLPGSN